MKTPQTNQKNSGSGPLALWRWTSMLAVFACLIMAGRASAGTLTVTETAYTTPTNVNLSAEGDLDWAKFGEFTATDFNHKAGVTSLIPMPTDLVSSHIYYNGDPILTTLWNDGVLDQQSHLGGNASFGVLVPGGSANCGFQINGLGAGFQLTIPASTTTTYLHLYTGSANTTAQLEVSLSDASAPSVTNTTPISDTAHCFTIAFAANSGSQTLNINYYSVNPINYLQTPSILLSAATLSSANPLPFSVSPAVLGNGTTLNSGSIFHVSANPTGGGTFTYQWQVSFNGGSYANIGGATSRVLETTAGVPGTYNYQVVVTSSLGGSPVTSAPSATLTVTAATGSLGVSRSLLTLALPPTYITNFVNLTAEGVTDWAYYGFTGPGGYETKANIIGNVTQLGADSLLFATYSANGAPFPAYFSWTDATTANTTSGGPTTLTYAAPITNGFELNIPVTTTPRVVNIYVNLVNANAHVLASLNNGSAPLFEDYPTATTGIMRYSFAISAASPTTLKFQAINVSRAIQPGLVTGAVGIQAATLTPVPALSVGALVVSPTNNVCVNQPITVSIGTFDPQGSPTFSYVWQRDPTGTGTSYANLPDTGRSATFTVGGSPGTENCRVIISDSQGSITSAPVVITRNANTGVAQILGSKQFLDLIDLTAVGTIDWAKYATPNDGTLGYDYKFGGGQQIGMWIPIGGGAPASGSFNGAAESCTWTDGTINTGPQNFRRAVYRDKLYAGFEWHVAAAATNRLLTINMGSFAAYVHMEAFMDDASTPVSTYDGYDFVQGNNGNSSGYFYIKYASPTPGAHLIVRVWFLPSTGNITAHAATLAGMPTLAGVGTPTVWPSTTVATGSTIKLQAQGAPSFWTYQWQLDSGSGYANIAGATSPAQPTSAGTGTVGVKNYRVVVTDENSSSITSAPVAVTVVAATGVLSGTVNRTDYQFYNLTADGSIDWKYLGNAGNTANVDVKNTLAGLINNATYGLIGPVTLWNAQAPQVPGGVGSFNWTSWSDGSPNATGVNVTSGVGARYPSLGFGFTANAATTNRQFSFNIGIAQGLAHLDATMSDGSAPSFVAEPIGNLNEIQDYRYSFTYSSPNPGAYLIVNYTMIGGNNVQFYSAAIGVPNLLKIIPVGGGQVQVTWPQGTLLQAPAVTGPWTTNVATSPYTFTPSGSQQYFRAIQ
ncbi:MAG: hypothetical protein PHY43_07950 [Verrucomicrobiales bacterium]|nr:hypothetical protein [Verrucomicrobiales bacterium]